MKEEYMSLPAPMHQLKLSRWSVGRTHACIHCFCTSFKKAKLLSPKQTRAGWNLQRGHWSWDCCFSQSFKVIKMYSIHQRACPCLLVHPSSQSWQAIVLSLFSLLLWSIVLNSWHISPHTLTSKIAFCQYEGKDSFGFNGAGHLMLDITGTWKTIRM